MCSLSYRGSFTPELGPPHFQELLSYLLLWLLLKGLFAFARTMLSAAASVNSFAQSSRLKQQGSIPSQHFLPSASSLYSKTLGGKYLPPSRARHLCLRHCSFCSSSRTAAIRSSRTLTYKLNHSVERQLSHLSAELTYILLGCHAHLTLDEGRGAYGACPAHPSRLALLLLAVVRPVWVEVEFAFDHSFLINY